MTESGSAASPPPMTIGQILDRIYRLMRAFWRTFFAIAAIPAVAVGAMISATIILWFRTIWPLVYVHPTQMPHIPLGSLVWIFGAGFLMVPIFVLYAPAALHAATQANLGIRVNFEEAYSVAWRHYGRYIWLMVLLLLYLYLPMAVIAALIGGATWFILQGAQPGSIPTGLFALIPAAALGYCGFLVYSTLIMLRFSLAFPACVVEGLTARAALRRSTSLTCGARGRIFVVLLVVYLVTYAVNMVLMNFLGFAGTIIAIPAMGAHLAGAGSWFVVGALAWFPMMAIYVAFTYAALTTALAVIYHDQRWRKDAAAPSALPA